METIEKHFEGLSECRLPPEAADYGFDDRTWDGSRYIVSLKNWENGRSKLLKNENGRRWFLWINIKMGTKKCEKCGFFYQIENGSKKIL